MPAAGKNEGTISNFIQELKGYQIYSFSGSLRTKSEIEPAINMFVFVRNDIKF